MSIKKKQKKIRVKKKKQCDFYCDMIVSSSLGISQTGVSHRAQNGSQQQSNLRADENDQGWNGGQDKGKKHSLQPRWAGKHPRLHNMFSHRILRLKREQAQTLYCNSDSWARGSHLHKHKYSIMKKKQKKNIRDWSRKFTRGKKNDVLWDC